MNPEDIQPEIRQLEATGVQTHGNPSFAARCSDDSAWPLKCIVEKLVEAADILLDEKDYDGHGHELISFARNEARLWLRHNDKLTDRHEKP